MPVIVPSVSSRFPRFDCALDGLDSLVPNSLPYLSRSHPSLLFTVRSSIPLIDKDSACTRKQDLVKSGS